MIVDRAHRVAQTFIADETFARGVKDMARAVDSVNASYVVISPVLADLAIHGPTAAAALGERLDLEDAKLALALGRLQDLSMATVSRVEEGQLVALTTEGLLAARQVAAT